MADQLDLRFSCNSSRDRGLFGARFCLPANPGRQPWVYDDPIDADDWARMLQVWLDEETVTGCAEVGLTTTRDGVPYFIVELYGFRHRDPMRHESLRTAARGWLCAPELAGTD